jgi:hypothetical protein
MHYLPYMVVPFYPLFQERGAQKVERPKADWEVRHLHTREREVRALISIRRIIPRRRHTKRFTNLYQSASGVPADEKLGASGIS